jgi:hypothetical protein
MILLSLRWWERFVNMKDCGSMRYVDHDVIMIASPAMTVRSYPLAGIMQRNTISFLLSFTYTYRRVSSDWMRPMLKNVFCPMFLRYPFTLFFDVGLASDELVLTPLVIHFNLKRSVWEAMVVELRFCCL